MKAKNQDIGLHIDPVEFDDASRYPPEPQGRSCAGLVLIVHGFNVGISGELKWTGAMQDAIIRRLRTNGRKGKIEVSGSKDKLELNLIWLEQDPFQKSDSDIIIRLDWTAVSNHLISRVTTQEIAVVLARLLCSQPAGLPDLSKIPIHLIGHSRGASLISELACLMGEAGISIDQMTTLDPHPLSEADLQPSVRDPVLDAPVRVCPNIRFADNYWQDISFPKGSVIPGAYNRCWNQLPGAYHFTIHTAVADHMNLIMLYHATISSQSPLENDEAVLRQANRETWFEEADELGKNTGYLYSRAVRPDLRPRPNA